MSTVYNSHQWLFVIGSVVVHAGADDLKTQPTGYAGARVGCGVIGIADPNMKM